MGLEPTTSTLARLRSTTELHPHEEPLIPNEEERNSMRGELYGCGGMEASLFLNFLKTKNKDEVI